MNNAEHADYREEEVRALNSARSADRAMMAGVWVGTGMIVVGLPLTIAGAVLKAQARSGVSRRIDIRGSGMAVRF
jgi:imidazolonepropionase-like amidohydrolase